MRLIRPLLAAVAAFAIFAAGETRAAPWTFTKDHAGWSARAVTSPASGVDAMVFTLTATGVGTTTLSKMAFMVVGSVQPGALTNYQIIYYPNGIASPGTVVGSSTGADWKMGPKSSIVTIPLSSPIAVPDIFTGVFALRVSVGGGASAFFEPRLQTVTTSTGGVEKFVLATEDLPLGGDTFYVN